MITPEDKKEIEDMIRLASRQDFRRRIGDTPTEDLHLVNKKYVDDNASTVYAGRVADDGSAVNLPSGWTSAKTGTGQYTVTHNLGTTAYGVAGLSTSANQATINLSAINANDFRVITWNNTPTNTDLPWAFVLAEV